MPLNSATTIEKSLNKQCFANLCNRKSAFWILVLANAFSTLSFAKNSTETSSRLICSELKSSACAIANPRQSFYVVAMEPERDADAILLDTLNEAIRSGNAGLLIKFIAKHPDHILAEKARQLLKDGNYPLATKTPTNGVDSKYVEFDKARRRGPDGLRGFIRAHPDHPLAKEAERMMAN